MSRWSSRARRAAGVRMRTRAAASSIASGSPSSRRQIADHVGHVRRIERKSRFDRLRPLDEEPHGRGGERLVRREPRTLTPGSGSGETGNSRSAREAQRLPARGQNDQPRRRVDEPADRRRGIDDLLEIVEQQQRCCRDRRCSVQSRQDVLTGSSRARQVPWRWPREPEPDPTPWPAGPTRRRRGRHRGTRPRPAAPAGSCRCRRTRSG